MTQNPARSSTDFLGGRVPRSDTPVPGHWALDLPFSPSILSVRRFAQPPGSRLAIPAAESSSDAAKRAAIETLLARAGVDELELAWRGINALGANEGGADPRHLLRSPCALVMPGKDPSDRELWLFELRGPNGSSTDQYHHEALEALTARQNNPEPFDVTDLLFCDTHKDASTCLLPGNTCSVEWRPETLAEVWRLFTLAVVEKLAWRAGRRIDTLGMHANGRSGTLPSYSLRLMTPSKLLLTAPSTSGPPSPYRPNTAETSNGVVTLPSRAAAVSLGPFEPSEIQRQHLDESFRATLGPSWCDGHERGRLLSRSAPKWSVYWVRPSTHPTSATSAAEAESEISRDTGVFVVWPTHLTHQYDGDLDSTPRPRVPKRAISAVIDTPLDNELMDVASSVFAFVSTYKEPQPPETEKSPPPADLNQASDIPTPMTGPTAAGSTPGMPLEADLYGSGTPKSESKQSNKDIDIDDLFSSTPTSPRATALDPIEPGPEYGLPAGTVDDFDDLFGGNDDRPPVELDRDVEMSGSPPAATPPDSMTNDIPEPYERYDAYGGGDELDMNQLTEADFAFLDSPDETAGAQIHNPPEEPPLAIPEDGTPDDETGRQIVVTQNGVDDQSRSPHGVYDVLPLVPLDDTAAGALAGTSVSEPSFARQTTQDVVDASHTGKAETSASSAIVNAERERELSPADRPTGIRDAPPSPLADFIPSPFAPLDIVRPTSLPAPVFTYPSPATTPEALRTDLVDRLRQAKKHKGNENYSSAWRMDEEPSEVDDEYDDSGAPPTPDSQDEEILTEDTTGTSSPAARGPETDDMALKWKGHTCVGAEWMWLQQQKEALALLSKPWNDEWADSSASQTPNQILHTPPPSPHHSDESRFDKVDLDRLAREVIGNRYFRKSLRSPATRLSKESLLSTEALDTNAALSDFLPDAEAAATTDDNDPIRPLGSCNVHAGFAGNIMRLSIAGLRYWRQLGLSPAGGEKKVVAYSITQPGEGARRAGHVLLRRMESLWRDHRLGEHATSSTADRPGVLPLRPDEMSSMISHLSRKVEPGICAVIYVLLDDGSLDSAIVHQAITQVLPETTIVHVVPLSIATQPRLLPDLAFDVYNRIPRLLHRIESRGAPVTGPPTYFQYPSFTLAPDSPVKPSLTLSWPVQSYDVLNRWRFVHAAYSHDTDSGLTVAFVIDAEGDNYEVHTWKAKDTTLLERMHEVWRFFVAFAEVAAIEWRMTITRVGQISHEEIQNWPGILHDAYVTLLNVDGPSQSIPATVIVPPLPSNIPPPVFASGTARLLDDTLTTHTARIAVRLPLSITGTGADHRAIYPMTSFILSMSTGAAPGADHGAALAVSDQAATAIYHVLSHRAVPGKEDERTEEVISRQFQRLAYLGRLRFGFDGGVAGVHVEAVETVSRRLASA